MGILETIIENCNKQIITNKEYTNIFINKTISKNYETKEKNIVEIFMKCLKEKIKIDTTTRYKNINDKLKDLYKATENNNFKYPDKTKSDEEKYTFSATKLNKNGKEYYYSEPEPTLEKLIKISTDFENQMPLPENGSHIDLMKRAGKTIKFVELKQWENSNNTPFWAVAESVINLYKFIHLYVNIKDEKDYFKKIFADRYESILKLYDINDIDTFNLIILAPKEYFLEYFSDKNQAKCKIIFYEKFCKELQKQIEIDLKHTFGKNYKIKFSTKYFDFTKEDFKNLVGYNNDTKYKDSIISTYLRDNNKNLRAKTDKDRDNEKHNKKLYRQKFPEFNTGHIWLGKNQEEKNYEYLVTSENKDKLKKWADYTEIFDDIIWEGNIYPRELKDMHYNKFREDNKYKKLTDAVKADKELMMCLRGNDSYTTVYYKGLQILKIHLNNNKFEIDKNYGTDFFKNLGIKPDIKGKCAFFETDSDFNWNRYFAESKKQINLHDRQKKTEKEFQQNIFSVNTCLNNKNNTDYIFFDVEYCFIPNKEIYPRKTARFDGLALKWTQEDRIKGKQAKLAIVELKVGLGSIKGEASLSSHYNDVSNFVKGIDIDKFISDMENVIIQMNNLGLININENLTKPFIDRNNLQFICVIKDYNENSKQLNDELNEMTICGKDRFNNLFKLIDNNNYELYEADLLSKNEILN